MDNKDQEELKQAWYAFAPSSVKAQKRMKKSVAFRILASVLVLALFVSAAVYPPKANEHGVVRRAPSCQAYPITNGKDFTGVIYFSESDKIVSAKYAVWEATKERQLYEEEIPKEWIDAGEFTIPVTSFWDDYVVNFTDYTGFGTKGDYNQQLRVTLRYLSANGEMKLRTFVADPIEASPCWMQQASKKHGALLVKEGYVTEIFHTAQVRDRIRECFIEQPGRVTRSDVISVRVRIDGKDFIRNLETDKVGHGLMIVRIPIPNGHEQDGTHVVEIYVTQYIQGFNKAIEFVTIDRY